MSRAWPACARFVAESISAKPYSEASFGRLERHSQLTADPLNFEGLASLFAEAGVRLVYVEAFSSSKLNGASFLLDGDHAKPVVAISGRGKRLDKVLFTLLHEVAHVVNGDVHEAPLVHDDSVHTLGDESAADELASAWIIPGGMPTPQLPIRSSWVALVAAQTRVHPIVIVGHLQNQGVLDWITQLVKGAPAVTQALEGWKRCPSQLHGD